MGFINDGKPFLRSTGPDLGLSRGRLDSALAGGELRAIVRGCYVDARVADSRALRLAAMNLVRPPGAVACNETAAFVFGLDVRPPSRRFELTPTFLVPHATTRIEHPAALCRQALIDSRDVVVVDGVPVTSPVRTVSDLLRRLYRPYALAAADAFAHAGLIDVPELVDYVHRLRGYRWIVQARSLSLLVDGRAASAGESWTRLRIHDAGFPPAVPQLQLTDHLGHVRYLDLGYLELRIAVEYDGREFHTLEPDRDYDRTRRENLTDFQDWRWVLATRSRIFGPDTAFEAELGDLLGMAPNPRRWGTR